MHFTCEGYVLVYFCPRGPVMWCSCGVARLPNSGRSIFLCHTDVLPLSVACPPSLRVYSVVRRLKIKRVVCVSP